MKRNLKRWWVALCVLFALAHGTSVLGAEPDPAKTVGDFLVRSGYTHVPLTCPSKPMLFVDVNIRGKPFRLLVDSGASVTVLCTPSLKKAGLTFPVVKEDVVASWGPEGKSVSGKEIRLEGLSIGGLPSVARHAFLQDKLVSYDDSDPKNPKYCDGILGGDAMAYFSAVIEYSEPALFLIEPIKRETGLQGEWQGVSFQVGGIVPDRPTAANWHVTFRGSSVEMKVDNMLHHKKLGIVMNSLTTTPREMNWVVDKTGSFNWIYRLEGDTLTLCGQVHGKETLPRPKEFKSTKENGYGLIVLKRVPAKAGPLKGVPRLPPDQLPGLWPERLPPKYIPIHELPPPLVPAPPKRKDQ